MRFLLLLGEVSSIVEPKGNDKHHRQCLDNQRHRGFDTGHDLHITCTRFQASEEDTPDDYA